MVAEWQVITDGELAAAAAHGIDAITADLQRLDPSQVDRHKHDVALYFAYAARATSHEGSVELADVWLNAAIEEAASVELHPALYGGAAGIAWTVEHLRALASCDDALDDEDPNADVDELMCEFVRHTPWHGDYDVISGLAGFGLYFLERCSHPRAREGVEQIVGRLEELAEDGRPGRRWLTPPERVPESQRRWAPRGYYNLGVAHGVPGIIGMLSHCIVRRVAMPVSAELLAGAVEWLLAQEASREAEERFPSWLAVGDPTRNASRLAWCYGDLGIALVLQNAGIAMNEAVWVRRATDIAVNCAQRSRLLARVRDAGLCHGVSGLVHMFNRLFQTTGDARFREAAHRWLRELLSMRADAGYGGFVTLRGTPDGTPAPSQWVADASFLTGSAGIGLALLATTSMVSPAWDRLLLASLPTRGPVPAS